MYFILIAQIIPNAIAHAWEVGSLQALEEVESAIARVSGA